MKDLIKNFINALQFLTLVTVSGKHRVEEGDLAKSMPYFPIIGFLIGLLLVKADNVFALLALPQTIASFLLVVILVVITRALHIDGLADTFDGLMGGHDHESRLAIMRDSRLGTAGALGIVLVVFMKFLCINTLIESDRVAALLTAPTLARWTQTLMVFNARYGRENGMAKAFVGHLRAGGLVGATVIAVGLSAFAVVRMDLHTVALMLTILGSVLALTYAGKWYLHRKLGGITGDAIGAMSELTEVLVLLIFVIFAI